MGHNRSPKVPWDELGGPQGHRVPSVLELSTAGDTAASFWVPRSGSHLHHHAGDGGMGRRDLRSLQDAALRMLMVIGCQGVKRVPRHGPDGAGLTLGFLYYCLCCRIHAGCHHTGTTTEPSHPGLWQHACLAQPEMPAQGKPPWSTPRSVLGRKTLPKAMPGNGCGAGDALRGRRSSAHCKIQSHPNWQV